MRLHSNSITNSARFVNFGCYPYNTNQKQINESPKSSIISLFDKESSIEKPYPVTFCTSPIKLGEVQKEIDNKFIISNNNEDPNSMVAHKLHKDKISGFSEEIKNILIKNNINTPQAIVAALKQTANISDEQIKASADTYRLECYKFNANKKMEIKREFLQTVIDNVSKNPNSVGILSQKEIAQIFSNALNKINLKYDSCEQKDKIKADITYQDDDFTEEKIELNKEEIEILKQAAKVKPDENISVKDLYDKVINLYVGGDYSLKYLPEKIQKAVLSSLPRYNSQKNKNEIFDNYRDFKNMPVSRWLYIKDPDEFVKTLEPDNQYSYNKLQSCSKNNSYCENQFTDDSPDMTVKFIIHPKSDTSKAYDLGDRKYGNKEVVYPPNQKFKILSKNLVEATKENYDYSKKESYTATFYRYEIHMQEV